MLQGEPEDLVLLANHVSCRSSDGDGLRRDHFAGYAAARIRIDGNKGVDAELMRRNGLQLPEQGVRGCVGTGHEHAEPTQKGGEEWEKPARGGEGMTQGDGHAGVVHNVGET